MRIFTNASGILAGGNIYFIFKIKANTADNWGSGITQIIFGTAPTNGYGAESTLWTKVLLSCSDIDEKINPLSADAIALTSDVNIELQNTTGAIIPENYLGRQVEIRLGTGTTMNDTTSDIIFVGNIIEVKRSSQTSIVLSCQSGSLIRNQPLGKPSEENAHEKYRGKMRPVAYGDFTDNYGYLPIMVMNPSNNISYIRFDSEAWHTFSGLYLWDDQLNRSYKALETNQFTIDSDKNNLNYIFDTGCILKQNMPENSSEITIDVSDKDLITYDAPSAGTDSVAKQSVIKIGSEMLLLIKNPASIGNNSINGYERIQVERGFNGSTIEAHNTNDVIYQISDAMSTMEIKISALFYPNSISGIQKSPNLTTFDSKITGGKAAYLTNGNGYVQYSNNFLSTALSNEYYGTLIDMIFESPGVDGTIINQYVKVQGDVYVALTNTAITGTCAVLLVRAGKHDSASSAYYLTTLIAQKTGSGNNSMSFNNITGSDSETTYSVTPANCKITTVQDLGSVRYSIGLVVKKTGGFSTIGRLKIYRMGFRIDFKVSPIKYDFFVRAKTRKNPGGYFNGSSGDLMENIPQIVEDIFRQEVGLSQSLLDQTSFETIATDRANWKLAVSISDDIIWPEGI